jgi:hypothetical protein
MLAMANYINPHVDRRVPPRRVLAKRTITTILPFTPVRYNPQSLYPLLNFPTTVTPNADRLQYVHPSA